MRLASTLQHAWREYTRRRHEARSHSRTIQAVSDLPPHILKDIGWPGSYEGRRGRR